MLGLKIFVPDQTFRRRPFALSRIFCHPAPRPHFFPTKPAIKVCATYLARNKTTVVLTNSANFKCTNNLQAFNTNTNTIMHANTKAHHVPLTLHLCSRGSWRTNLSSLKEMLTETASLNTSFHWWRSHRSIFGPENCCQIQTSGIPFPTREAMDECEQRCLTLLLDYDDQIEGHSGQGAVAKFIQSGYISIITVKEGIFTQPW